MSRIQRSTAVVLLAFCYISSAIGQDEDTSRSVRIIDEPKVLAPPPSAPQNPSAVPPEFPKPEGGASAEPAPPSDSGTPNPSPRERAGAAAVPTPPPTLSPSGKDVLVVANPAELTVEMLPDTRLLVGSRVSFRISAKKSGFLILVDIDSTGKVTQIYPSPVSLMAGLGKPNSNFIRPGKSIQIPSPVEPYMGFEFVASPPLGTAMIVAMLSDQPVQMIDLPDIPVSLIGQNAAVNFLGERTSELRVPSVQNDDKLQRPIWSLSAKFYEIKQAPD
jgi:hypothetical protein